MERFQTVPYMTKNANYSAQPKLRTTKEKIFHLTGLKTRTTTESNLGGAFGKRALHGYYWGNRPFKCAARFS
ncbi:MAG: hypothetical protein ACLPSL_00775 [Smithella sp.]